MAHQYSARLAEILTTDPGVKESYRHISKWVSAGDPLQTGATLLKWYELAPANDHVSESISHLARACLARGSLEASGLGFVILHRCTNEFYFLIVNTWRGNNEVWETVFYKDGDSMSDFAPFPREGAHKPTFCVWELAPVWHEKEAWERFLKSSRDQAAAEEWLRDRYAGSA
jgi:hypothetical protein